MSRYLHTMYRITDPERSRAFYEALGFTFARDMDIVRDGQREATNYFFSMGDQDSVLELTYNHDGRTYELGSGYGHIAVGVDDLRLDACAPERAGDRARAPAVPGAGGRVVPLLCAGPRWLASKIDFQPGDRTELVRCTDEHADLKPGDRGTVSFVECSARAHLLYLSARWHSSQT
jgi:lactoylglutathione lyase